MTVGDTGLPVSAAPAGNVDEAVREPGSPATGDRPVKPSRPGPDRPGVAVAQGLAGSLMIFVGSLGVGWLANGSALLRNPLMIMMRTDANGVIASTALLTLGAMLLIRSWLRLGQRLAGWGAPARRPVLWAVAAWTAPLLAAVPIFSRDVYAYIGQGRLMVEGMNPYTTGISSLSNWYSLGADQAWAQNATPYGPYFLWLEQLVVSVTGASPETSVFLFRLLAVAGVALCAYYVPKLAALHGIDPARALWLSVANPLFLISFVASAHNDALMVGLALAGTYYAATKRPVLGVVLVTASIGIKPITVVLLPFIGLLWAGINASWPRKFLAWAKTLLLAGGLLWVTGLVNGFGFDWIGVISNTGDGWMTYAPTGFLGMVVQSLVDAVGLDGWAAAKLLRSFGRLVAIGLVVWLMFKGDDARLVRRMALAFSAVVLLSPVIQPWYVLWLIPLLAVTGIRDDWQTKAVYVVVVYFVVMGAQDQLSVLFFVDLQIGAPTVAMLVALAFLFYLLFLDPKTRRLVATFSRAGGAPAWAVPSRWRKKRQLPGAGR